MKRKKIPKIVSFERKIFCVDDRGYALPYETDGRKVVKVGVKFNDDTRVLEEWAKE